MVLRLHRATDSATLAEALAALLAQPLADPFTTEVVAVPAKGVERWLTQRLSGHLGAEAHRDGIAANIAFPNPARLVDEVIAAASGFGPAASSFDADDDPWAPGRVLWALVRVIDESAGEPWAAVLARHLGHGTQNHRIGRRYGTAAHIAQLFRRYGADRPQLLIDWAGGRFTDGLGAPLPADLQWQPELWRALRERIDAPSPAERLTDVCRRIAETPDVVTLPERLSVFGPTRLTAEQLRILAALGEQRDVHLWIPHPSPALWTTLADVAELRERAADDSALRVRNPLLASLSRDVRELQSRLAGIVDSDDHHDAPTRPATLLTTLQADLAADRVPTGGIAPDDSIAIHACHGQQRQVEVLREALLHLFADDPTLEPRDVLVMCPDIETFAPLIRAAFGQGALEHPGHSLRVSLADRAVRQTNPLLALLASLLQLADGRVTASELLDLAATAPVRRRFGFDDEDLERLRDWTGAAGARWGISRRQRAAFGLGDFPQNTFTTAIDRILLGVTADETTLGWLDRTLPLDDVESNDIDLAGRFAEFVDRTDVVLRDLSGARPAAEWATGLTRALDLLAEVGRAETWQLGQARREIAAAVEHGRDVVLRLPDVRAMLGYRLAGRPTRANFRTGDLTVATLVPMRSVPHRVVVLLGLDDEVYPRAGGADGDDVLARNPCVGERDPRSEDRQLLLDAVMSAREKLLVFYTGADPVTGAHRPPAVPIGELLDAIAATLDGSIEPVLHRQPLQNFDPRDFAPREPFSFDRQGLAGALAQSGTPQPVPPFLPAALPTVADDDVSLADLVAFVAHPTKAFLRQRLGVRVPEREDEMPDALSAELDGLEKWAVGERLLRARLQGVPMAELADAEWRRGTLPPFALGRTVIDDVAKTVEALVSACARDTEPETIDVTIDLGSGRRLIGTVGDVYGTQLVATKFSSLKPQDRLMSWVRLLAIAAARPGSWTAEITGRSWGNRLSRATQVAPTDPVAVLRTLVDLRDRGLAQPLPISTNATATYAERRAGGTSIVEATDAAAEAWDDRFGDHTDPVLRYVFGEAPSFAEFTKDAPLPDEREWYGEPTRFGVLAARLWAPLLALETVRRV